MTQSLTKKIGAFVAALDFAAIPEKATQTARAGFVDCIGVMIAGRESDAPRILQRVLAPGRGAATLGFTQSQVSAPEAAWINGTAAHALDFDDMAVRGHPSTVLVPAILAEAEHLDASGASMLTAYVAGYETWAELALREKDSVHSKGWHPTGIWGAVAAAAACSSLRRLSAESTSVALALGASQSAGLLANFGTMTKPFHAGRSAHAGVVAARLAEAGFTASTDALEHPQGLLCAVSQHGNTDREAAPDTGTRWHIVREGLNIKQYPLCYCTHRCIDGLLALVRESGCTAQDVESITAVISDRYATILRNHRPKTGLEAKFSMEFAMAATLTAGRVGLGELTDDFVNRADVQSLMRRVRIETGSEYDSSNPDGAPYDQVRVQLKNGRVLEGSQVRRARGHADLPFSNDDLYEKFELCLDSVGAKTDAALLFDRLMSLETISARQLTSVRS
ncbi:MmgE/PrpD family protein [Paraburkholderia sediminicola]|uniref:MmgE/PrpD family protein n=1 Tax=Burkholderiaceae TaxID=119060 RepID=UPI000899E7D8|nr:MmgE/PrpD family protein [Burkholderia sp. WP9]SEF14389.1 2-methylcitrate dehydratase PrpD [Burkholderia sp. WP9]